MNPVTIDASALFGIVGFLVGISTLITFVSNRRKSAVEEGKRLACMEEIRRDLDHAYEKIHSLEKNEKETDKVLTEMRTDIKHILRALENVQSSLERRKGEQP